MKALVLVLGCLVMSAPAQAFRHGGMHGHHPGVGFHHLGLAIISQGNLPDLVAPEAEAAPQVVVAPGPQIVLAPGPSCASPAAVEAPARRFGPHIIYIGHQPAVAGPRVIYGTD